MSRPFVIWASATVIGGVLIVAGWLLAFTVAGAAVLALGVAFVAFAAAYAFASHQPRRRVITVLLGMVALFVLAAPVINLAAWSAGGFHDDNHGSPDVVTPMPAR